MLKIILTVTAMLLMVPGCNKNIEDSCRNADLDRLLQGQVDDVVAPGEREDSLLYASDKLCVWFRKLAVSPGDTVVLLRENKRESAIYIFSGRRCLATIASGTLQQPFAPVVYSIGNKELILISYDFMPDTYLTLKYIVSVYKITTEECKRVLEHEFVALKYSEDKHPITTLLRAMTDLNGQFMLVQSEYEFSTTGGSKSHFQLRCDKYFVWNDKKSNLIINE